MPRGVEVGPPPPGLLERDINNTGRTKGGVNYGLIMTRGGVNRSLGRTRGVEPPSLP